MGKEGQQTEPEAYLVNPETPRLRVLLYGDPGSGKTSLAASAQDHPAMRNVLFLNIEGGLLSIAHRGDIHAVDIKSTEELERVFWQMARGEKYESVRTVVIDSATELQTINLEEIVSVAMEKGGTSRSGKTRSRDEVWQDDYGKSTVQLKRMFRWFKELDKNVIFTALAKRVYPKVPEGTDMAKVEPLAVLPSVTAKLGDSLRGYVDMVWYCFLDPEDGRHKMLTRQNGSYFAKTRGPVFASKLGDDEGVVTLPNDGGMAKVYDLLLESLTPAEEAPRPKAKARK